MKRLKLDVVVCVASFLIAALVCVFVAYFVAGWFVFGNVLNLDGDALMAVSCSTNNPCRIEVDDFAVKLTYDGGLVTVSPLDSPWENDSSIARLADGGHVPCRLNGQGRFYVLIGDCVDFQVAAHVFEWLAENHAGRVYAVFGVAGMTNSMIGACCKVSQVDGILNAQFSPVDLSGLNSFRRFCGLICNRIVCDAKRFITGGDDFVLCGPYASDEYALAMSRVRSIGVCVVEGSLESFGESEYLQTNRLYLAERKIISDEKQVADVIRMLHDLIEPPIASERGECAWDDPVGRVPQLWQIYFDEEKRPLFSTCWDSSGQLLFTMADAYVVDGNGRYEFRGQWRSGSCMAPEFMKEFSFLLP